MIWGAHWAAEKSAIERRYERASGKRSRAKKHPSDQHHKKGECSGEEGRWAEGRNPSREEPAQEPAPRRGWPPQRTKFQEAPCQSPPRSMVKNRLK
jgi:hypothetical protein